MSEQQARNHVSPAEIQSAAAFAPALKAPAAGTLAAGVPDFFIVGHAKCGTTALYEMLRRHPQIHMPAKEPRFFAMPDVDSELAKAGDSLTDSAAPGPQEETGRRPHTLGGYVALFSAARQGQLVGEATPAYMRSPVAAGRIAAVRPDARIIAILREPASFLRSFHLQSVRGYNETQKDFRKALELVEERRRGRQIPRLSRTPADLLYTDHVRYVEQLRRFHDVFSRERVLVLVYEDFRRDNRAVVREVLRFLELDDTQTIEPVQTRPSRDLRFQQIHRLVNLRRTVLRNMPLASALSRRVDALTPKRMRGSLRRGWRRVAYGEPSPPNEQFMRELRRSLRPEVQALSEYLNRDLVGLWGYDDLG